MRGKGFLLARDGPVSTPIKLEHLCKGGQFVVISTEEIRVLHHSTQRLRHEGWVFSIEQVKSHCNRFSDSRQVAGGQVRIILLGGLVAELVSIEQFGNYALSGFFEL